MSARQAPGPTQSMQSPDTSKDTRELDALMQDKLEAHCRQQLSAMVDGALAPDEARFLLRRLQHDAELSGRWERWQVYGDLMRGGVSQLLPGDFSQRVVAALEAESMQAQPAVVGRGARGGWTRWAGGAALAASVAMAALVVVQRNPQGDAAAGATAAPVAAITQDNAPGAAAPDASNRLAATEAAPADNVPAAPSTLPGQAPAGDGGTAAVVAAAALAASDAPRRVARRQQATRAGNGTPEAASQRDTVVQPQVDADQAIAVAGVEDGSGRQQDPFGIEAPASASVRPWPRAVLPGVSHGGFNVGYGQPAQADAAQSPGFDYFEPQLPAEERVDDVQAASTANR